MGISGMTEEQIKAALGDLIAEDNTPKVRKIKFQPLKQKRLHDDKHSIEFLNDVVVDLSVELGRCQLSVRKILKLAAGSVIELDKPAGEEVEVLINGQPFVSAEVVIINDTFGVRVNSFLEGMED